MIQERAPQRHREHRGCTEKTKRTIDFEAQTDTFADSYPKRTKVKGTDMSSTRLKFIGCALAIVVILSLTSPPASQSQKPQNVEARINALLARMTLEEKLGQLQQLDGEANGNFRPEHLQLARQGLLGSTLNVRGAQRTNELQRIAMTESRLKIPLIFGFDVIHG
jgi:hypothetical protein